MKRPFNLLMAAGALLIVLAACNARNNEVFEWRGADRAGIYPDQGLLKEWPEEGLPLVWEFSELGQGYGSPVFTRDGMYIMGEADSLGILFAFDLEGKLLWKSDYGTEWMKNYKGPRCAPTIAGDQVYLMSGMGRITCFNRHTGEKEWTIGMMEDLNGVFPLFGHTEALAVDRHRIFCTPGGRDTNVVALDRFTGEILWISSGRGERPGYNQPKVIRLPERNILVTYTAYEMLGLDTETGDLLWVHEQDNTPVEERRPGMGDTHSNTVLFEDGFIYYAAGDGNCGVKLELAPDGSSIREVWRLKEFDSYMGGIVKIGDYLYGGNATKPNLMSVNAMTGEPGMTLGVGSGALIAADGMLYYYTTRGDIMLITADPLNMEVKGKFKITKGSNEHFAHPVINDGKLYMRRGGVLMAFELGERLQ